MLYRLLKKYIIWFKNALKNDAWHLHIWPFNDTKIIISCDLNYLFWIFESQQERMITFTALTFCVHCSAQFAWKFDLVRTSICNNHCDFCNWILKIFYCSKLQPFKNKNCVYWWVCFENIHVIRQFCNDASPTSGVEEGSTCTNKNRCSTLTPLRIVTSIEIDSVLNKFNYSV